MLIKNTYPQTDQIIDNNNPAPIVSALCGEMVSSKVAKPLYMTVRGSETMAIVRSICGGDERAKVCDSIYYEATHQTTCDYTEQDPTAELYTNTHLATLYYANTMITFQHLMSVIRKIKHDTRGAGRNWRMMHGIKSAIELYGIERLDPDLVEVIEAYTKCNVSGVNIDSIFKHLGMERPQPDLDSPHFYQEKIILTRFGHFRACFWRNHNGFSSSIDLSLDGVFINVQDMDDYTTVEVSCYRNNTTNTMDRTTRDIFNKINSSSVEVREVEAAKLNHIIISDAINDMSRWVADIILFGCQPIR